jgi:hypothetical protein
VLGVDINTQQSFEALSERAVAVVVDPIQSVKGKVVIDAFRLINPNMMVLGQVRYGTNFDQYQCCGSVNILDPRICSPE